MLREDLGKNDAPGLGRLINIYRYTMTDRELAIIHLVLENQPQSTKDCDYLIEHWRERIDDMLQEEHCGDCTNQPCVCYRCVGQEAYSMAPVYRYLFGE